MKTPNETASFPGVGNEAVLRSNGGWGVPAKQIRTLTDEEVAQNAADAALYVEIGKQMERDGIAAAGANMPRNIPAIGIE